MGNIATTVSPVGGGVTEVAGVAKRYRLEYGGTWAADDTTAVNLTNAITALTQIAGAGMVTGLRPSFAFTFSDKVNLLAGSGWYFSAVDGPTTWNDAEALGNGFVEIANQVGTPQDLVAMAQYQGRVALIAPGMVQIWSVDPDRNNYQRGQTLPKVGTRAPLSVRSVGDMDVYMLADNGVRSIRVRDSSNNAIIADIGTPIDEIIQAVLNGLTDTQKAAACGVVEPSSNRYWLYLPGNYIYVFSYFPTSEVAAWSRYRARAWPTQTSQDYVLHGPSSAYYVQWTGLVVGRTYSFLRGPAELAGTACAIARGDTWVTYLTDQDGTFVAAATTAWCFVTSPSNPGQATAELYEAITPEKFEEQNSRVYVRSGNDIYLYGGSANLTYDRCLPQWDTPFLNAKSPATRKTYHGMDAICEGRWIMSLGTNVANAGAVTEVINNTGPSVMRGKALTAKQGTHFKVRAVETGSAYARFSSAILHYEGGENK